MKDLIIRRLFLGFIQVHILYHASKEPVYGLYMIEELKSHGYQVSSGTLYPLLHSLESAGLLQRKDELVDGKIRKYYSITPRGGEVLGEAREKARELVKELEEA